MVFIRVPIGSLPRGLKGDQGDEGAPGPMSVDNDTVMAERVKTATSLMRAALRRTVADNGGIYLPTPTAMLRWRTRRTATIAKTRQAHIAVLGDSIPFGAAGSGTSSPKYRTNWVGRVRSILDATYGYGGTGVVIADANIRANPTWDDRFAYSGSFTDQGFGFHQTACFRGATASANLQFTAICDEFVVTNFSGSIGVNSAQIDGGAAKTFRNYAQGGVVTNEREPGFHSGQIVTSFAAGTLAAHTLKLTPGTGDIFVGMVEGRVATPGTFRVSNPSISGKSLGTLMPGGTSETTGLIGLPLVDALQADLLVIALGVNDWMGNVPVATAKANLTALIQRQMASGANAGGGNKAAGDVLLLWNPQPDLTVLGVGAPNTWAQYREMFYEVADEQNIALLDMGARWKDYATGNAAGLFGDGIHPNDTGSLDMAPAFIRAIMAAV